jgi:CheY-like chemotaxis protein
MTNETILNVLTNLCNEIRNSVHANFGTTELQRYAMADPSVFACLEISRSSADRLLRSMDDLRELLSGAPTAPGNVDEFDAALCLREKAAQIRLEASSWPVLVRQDREAVEQVLTRTLDATSKLTAAGDVHVTSSASSDRNGVRFAITPPDSAVAVRLADWLNADPEKAGFQNAAEASLGVAVLVAGQRLRALGGTADLVRNFGQPAHLAIHVHSQPAETGFEGDHHRPDTLNILLAEDSDDSYALAELLLRKENLWRARDGVEAIGMLKKRHFDVVFMDVHMPGIDGYTAIRAIREWETSTGKSRTPIVVLSSDDLETQRQYAAPSGCSGFLRKPLCNDDLLGMLDGLKETRREASHR